MTNDDAQVGAWWARRAIIAELIMQGVQHGLENNHQVLLYHLEDGYAVSCLTPGCQGYAPRQAHSVELLAYDADEDRYYASQNTNQTLGLAYLCCEHEVEVPTAYGARVTCTVHGRRFTRMGVESWVEEKYQGFGVDGN